MFKFFRHLFIPHHTNNHRAKLLHNSSLTYLVLSIFAASFLFIYLQNTRSDVLGVSYSISGQELLELTNQVRGQNNVAPVVLNSQLSAAAVKKAQDMFEKNYWAHFAPDSSTTPWKFIKDEGYNYIYAGENLAKGFTTSEEAIQAWMNSTSHRENMLSPKYTDIGFAVVEGKLTGEETVLIVEMLGSTHEITSGIPTVPRIVMDSQSTLGAENNVYTFPKFDSRKLARNGSLLVFGLLLIVFVLDLYITKRKKIPRLVGHNFDHILLIALFILFIIFEQSGGIL